MFLFDADRVFFTVLNYDMSYVEFFGTVLNLASVWLVARRSIWTWPVGIAGVIFFAVLFYQIELYSDFIEQIYFLISGVYGWRVWSQLNDPPVQASSITRLSGGAIVSALVIIGVGTAVLTVFMVHSHEWLPSVFRDKAAYPFLDALTTVMSFCAQALMAHKKLESWILWIAVDVIGIGLYWVKDVHFISLLYVVFLVLATRGLLTWWTSGERGDSRAEPASLVVVAPETT